jgi:hypothetical protein
MKKLVIIVICALLFVGLGTNPCSAQKNSQKQKKMTKKELRAELTKQKKANEKLTAKLTTLNAKFDSLANKLKNQNEQLQGQKTTAENEKAKAKSDSITAVNLEKQKTAELQKQKAAELEKQKTIEVKKVEVQKSTEAIKPSIVVVKGDSLLKAASKTAIETSPVAKTTVKDTVKKAPSVPVAFMTSGRLFNVPVTDKDHYFTVKEVSEILDTIINGKPSTTKWYTLASGLQVQMLHPVEWTKLVMMAYVSIDSSLTNTKKFLDAVKSSDTADWNAGMYLTNNYYWSAYGKVAFIPDYNGTTHGAKVITFKGFPVLKMNCLNPQLPAKSAATGAVANK